MFRMQPIDMGTIPEQYVGYDMFNTTYRSGEPRWRTMSRPPVRSLFEKLRR